MRFKRFGLKNLRIHLIPFTTTFNSQLLLSSNSKKGKTQENGMKLIEFKKISGEYQDISHQFYIHKLTQMEQSELFFWQF